MAKKISSAKRTYTYEEYLKEFCPEHMSWPEIEDIEDDREFEETVIRTARRMIERRKITRRMKEPTNG